MKSENFLFQIIWNYQTSITINKVFWKHHFIQFSDPNHSNVKCQIISTDYIWKSISDKTKKNMPYLFDTVFSEACQKVSHFSEDDLWTTWQIQKIHRLSFQIICVFIWHKITFHFLLTLKSVLCFFFTLFWRTLTL